MRAVGRLSILLPLIVIASLPSFGDSCRDFASYTCSQSTPNVVHLQGTGTTSQSVGILLGTSAFTVTLQGNKSFAGDDLVIVAAAPGSLTGALNGVALSSLFSFPEHGATGAIQDTWTGMGIQFSSPSYGYANLGAIGSVPFSITANGVGNGTILYAEIVNPQTGKILYITPNSEAGILQVTTTATPEPTSLALFGAGLAGLGVIVRRKAAKD